MGYLVLAVLGFGLGGLAMYFALDAKRRRLDDALRRQVLLAEDNERRLTEIRTTDEKLGQERASLSAEQREFDKRAVSYSELQNENSILKQDLRNVAVTVRKLQLDRHLQQRAQDTIHQKVNDIGKRYLKDSIKWISNSLNANNFVHYKERLLDVIQRCRGIGFEIPKQEEDGYIADLRAEFEKAVRAAFQREEQARIKAQIREEQRLEREVQRELARVERERVVLQEALSKALATAADEHSAEIESLKARLAEAEAKQRAISQAQLTKAGYVYVISNIGSFGEDVYKIGMTRRLEPEDRVRELGDASVPFPFDIHMMISCDNAPALENALHHELFKQQVNKINPRKEFFKADIPTIVQIVREHHGEVEYTADAEALQYRQSLSMSDEDLDFIEHTYDKLEDDNETSEEGNGSPAQAESVADVIEQVKPT